MSEEKELSSFAEATEDKGKKEPSVAEAMKGKEAVDWQAKAEEYLNGWKRAQADYQNREKEIGKEREVLRGLFEEAMILEFLPVLDNLEKAVEGLDSQNKWVEGIGYVIIQFREVLRKMGVEAVNVIGKKFDPNLAEAVEGRDNKESFFESEEVVVEVIQKCYKRGGKIIRPAKVVVGYEAEKRN